MCAAGGQVSGGAGGERNTTPARMEVSGLASALEALAASGSASGVDVLIHTPSVDLARFAGLLQRLPEQPGADAPAEDLDVWARIVAAAKGRRLKLTLVLPKPDTPAAFAAAWANLAMDKSKSTGAFTSAIPRPNLTKIAGLEA